MSDVEEPTPFGHTCEESRGKIKGYEIDRDEEEVRCNHCGKSWPMDVDLWDIVTESEDVLNKLE